MVLVGPIQSRPSSFLLLELRVFALLLMLLVLAKVVRSYLIRLLLKIWVRHKAYSRF